MLRQPVGEGADAPLCRIPWGSTSRERRGWKRAWRFVVAAAFWLLLLGLLPTAPDPEEARPGPARDAAILDAALDRQLWRPSLLDYFTQSRESFVARSVVLNTATVTGLDFARRVDSLASQNSGVPAALLERIKQRNAVSTILRESGSRFVKYLDSPEGLRAVTEGSWNSFSTRYPEAGTCVSWALPAYSDDGHTALVYVERYAGFNNSSGSFYVVKRVNGGWRVIEEILSWVT